MLYAKVEVDVREGSRTGQRSIFVLLVSHPILTSLSILPCLLSLEYDRHSQGNGYSSGPGLTPVIDVLRDFLSLLGARTDESPTNAKKATNDRMLVYVGTCN